VLPEKKPFFFQPDLVGMLKTTRKEEKEVKDVKEVNEGSMSNLAGARLRIYSGAIAVGWPDCAMPAIVESLCPVQKTFFPALLRLSRKTILMDFLSADPRGLLLFFWPVAFSHNLIKLEDIAR
jgi:hypothetical protein